ncbi:hypothetical protein [Streptomyces tanashiensis]|uniref:Uncharacterized protein n=1 Tax=Streptomyces tanashiensis TaxID=67367 RepID=A0ABY6QYF7_9ACTN|nr:hypothetical protein [Streptomyces tanashiensis]UZX22219.1 hypothetical protein LDH80_16445 [Streptomyces tanashiensis]GGY06023.1 hypothetical protein GCM10010299_06710 [Streptomyces tanashiensis]
MATPERAEPSRDHVSMSELLASCAAARALSTPPPEPSEQGEEDETVRDEAA